MQYPPNHPTLLILRASSRGFTLLPQPSVTRARSVSNRNEFAIHSYIGGISYDTTNRTFATVICRSLDMTGLGGSSTNVSSYISNYGVVAGNQVTCALSTTEKVH